jgi:hypothetical protein
MKASLMGDDTRGDKTTEQVTVNDEDRLAICFIFRHYFEVPVFSIVN